MPSATCRPLCASTSAIATSPPSRARIRTVDAPMPDTERITVLWLRRDGAVMEPGPLRPLCLSASRRNQEGARYVYYLCTGYKGRCGELYVSEEVLERCPCEVLGSLPSMTRCSSGFERLFTPRRAALSADQSGLQHRLEAIYIDKLGGRIDPTFLGRMSIDWRAEQGAASST